MVTLAERAGDVVHNKKYTIYALGASALTRDVT